MDKIIIHLICPDQKGIIAQITSIILQTNNNILSIEQHVDNEQNKFYIRLLIDLKDSMTLADQLNNLYKNDELRKKLIENGKKQLKFYNSIDHISLLTNIIEDFAVKRNCWK